MLNFYSLADKSKVIGTMSAEKKSETEGDLTIYGTIVSEKFWDDDVSPGEIKSELSKIDGVQNVNVFINSPGGNTFAGIAIFNTLKKFDAKITVHVDGVAASAASIIAMAGDEVRMPPSSMMMIHNAWTIAIGNAADFRKLADDLDQIGKAVNTTYLSKINIDEEELQTMLDGETWLTAAEAVQMGFADVLEDDGQDIESNMDGDIANFNGQKFATDNFKNFPKDKMEKVKTESPEPDNETGAVFDKEVMQLHETQVRINSYNFQEV